MIPSKTLFKGSGPTALPADLRCPTCRLPTQGRPFCAHDGQLVRGPFTIADRYVVDELLGAGATALVFGGHDQQLGRPVALKILRPQLSDEREAKRFLRAARLSSQLHHENIVVVHDCGEDPALGVAFLVMERLTGGTVADVRAQSTRLTWQRTVRILVQVCRALAESHRHGILHRDLSLRNITLITSSGRSDVVKLCDFGLARSAAGDDRITSTGTAVGTPAYMAPEQVRGDEGQDHRVDLYALGVVAYEMLSGRLPHESATPVGMIAAKIGVPPTPLSERCPDLALPAELEALVMRCLDPEPSGRPESANAIEHALLALGDGDATIPRSGDLIGQTIGHYRVVERLKQGGMGEIYVVQHDVIGNKAALKVLLPEIATNPEATARFIQEVKASAGIRSAAIPRCYDFGHLPDGRAYVLMELIEGESVGAEIEKRGPLALRDVKQIVQQVTAALTVAHDVGIIHRDIKPEHIMVRRGADDVQVSILDFGIAKVFTGSTALTQVGVFMGTPLYCAPEQVLGEQVSPATDIYSLGATIYEMLTGRPPFSGETGHVLAIKTQRDPVPLAQLVPTLPPGVVATVTAMMSRDPARRPASMRAVASDVATWPTGATDLVTATPRRSRVRPYAIAAIAACVLLAAAIALWPSGGGHVDHAPSLANPAAPVPPLAPPLAQPSSPPTTSSPVDVARPTDTARPDVPATKPDGSKKTGHKKDAPHAAKPADKPPTTRPASGSADVLIVDPF